MAALEDRSNGLHFFKNDVGQGCPLVKALKVIQESS